MKSPAPSVVIAGGGTAGHIEPALAVAEAMTALNPQVRITALGTSKGLEGTLVPARGFELRLIPAVPVPRTMNKDLLTLPLRLGGALSECVKILKDVQADALIGFGGYVCAPAYIAAKRLGIPFFVHEANARAGMANKLGIRLGGKGLAAVEGSGLQAEVVGIPVKQSVLDVNRSAQRDEAREFFGVDKDAPLLLVTGGSQGARSINKAMEGAAQILADSRIGVLHAYGLNNELHIQSHGGPAYVALPYIERMDMALAAADMVLCRSGAMTVAEVSAVGLPGVYVPLPHGNGEQELNARPVVDAGGGVIIPDAELSPQRIVREVVPVLRDPARLSQVSAAALRAGHRDAARIIAQRVLDAAGGSVVDESPQPGKDQNANE